MKKTWYSVKEVSMLTGLSISTVRSRIADGRFTVMPRIGRERLLISGESISNNIAVKDGK